MRLRSGARCGRRSVGDVCVRDRRLSFTSTDAMADPTDAIAMRIGIDIAMYRRIEPARNEQAAA
jgi:hypothetical protein